MRTRAPAKRRSVEGLRAAFAVALCVSAAVGIGLAFAITRSNAWPVDGGTAALAVDLSLIYLVPYALGLSAAAIGLRLLGRRPGLRDLAAVAVAMTVLLNGLQRFLPAVQLVSVVPHMSAIGWSDLVVVMAMTAAAGLGVASPRPARLVAGLATACALWLGLSLLHAWHEKPLERDLAQAVPAALAAAPVAPPAPSDGPFVGARVALIGFDGLSWEVLLPLLREGELPNIRALLSDGAWGYLATLPFAHSPVIWESIATSQPPLRHSIGYHGHFQVPGLAREIHFLPSYALAHTPMRVRSALSWASRFGLVNQTAADAADSMTARLWEIASRSGLSVGVYDWLQSAPVAPVHGFIYGFPPIDPRVYPPDLEAGLEPLPWCPPGAEVGVAWLHARLPFERASYDRFSQLVLRFRPDVLMYYTHVSDAVNHMNWKQETWGDGLFFSGFSHPDVEPEPATRDLMRMFDDVVGDLRGRLPADALLMIVSDHGFDFRGYEHDNSPPGVIIVHGTGVKPGLVVGASIYDVTPTILHWLELPVAEDMMGAPLPIAVPGGRLDRAPARIPTYGPAAHATQATEQVDAEALHEYQQYLRQLGYVN